MEVEEISENVSSSSDNVSSAAEPSLANASSSRQTATTAPTSPACLASTNGEPRVRIRLWALVQVTLF